LSTAPAFGRRRPRQPAQAARPVVPTQEGKMQRATKIVATIGPASSDPETLTRMIHAGVDVVRLNFSHGKGEDHIERAALVRRIAADLGREVAIMADLQGPKIRVG
jgi:pyruvate kinase